MTVLADLCRTWLETRRLVFSRHGSFDYCSLLLPQLTCSLNNTLTGCLTVPKIRMFPQVLDKGKTIRAAMRENWFRGFRPGLTVQPQKKVKILKFWLEVKEELYYPSSENKGADQLCRYCTADLRFCFRRGENPVFS